MQRDTGTTPTVITVLTHDHGEVEQMFAEIESLPTTEHERLGALAERVVTELVQHSVAEEQYLYPAVREHLPRGDEMADHEIAEHAEAEQTMKRLEKLEPSDPEFVTTLSALIGQIRHHVQDEEGRLFPALAVACDRSYLEKLGEQVQRAKTVAPTRPHPSAPDRPPLNKVLGLGAGLVDRVRDALTGRGRESS
jgi:hemerythrin-like domain-containing protein